jgi:hypothetical protein
MIAPVREDRPSSAHRPRGLTMARRAVAAVLFQHSDEPAPASPRVSSYVAWTLIAWVMTITASYFAFWSWWAIDGY